MKKIIFMLVFSLTALTATDKAIFTISNSGILDIAMPETQSDMTTGRQSAVNGVISNSINLIWADMHEPNTGWVSNMPAGYKQFQGASIKDPQNLKDTRDWDHLNIWVEIEAAGDGSGCSHDINQATNTRVELGRTIGYVLIDGKWKKFTESLTQKGAIHPNPGQSNFPMGTSRCNPQTDYFYNIQKAHLNYDIDKFESNGHRSVKPKYYFRWHGWAPRNAVDRPKIQAVFAQYWVRLIVEDPNKTDDRHLAQYVTQISADKYIGTCGGPDCYRGSLGSSRYKKITNEWQPVNFLTSGITREELEANPPPFLVTPQ